MPPGTSTVLTMPREKAPPTEKNAVVRVQLPPVLQGDDELRGEALATPARARTAGLHRFPPPCLQVNHTRWIHGLVCNVNGDGADCDAAA